MGRIIKNIPVPFSGVILSSFILGNILQSFSAPLHDFFGIWGSILLFLFLSKSIFFQKELKRECNNPVSLSVAGTFTMAIMLWSTYIVSWNKTLALLAWTAGVILHMALILCFSMKNLRHFHLKNVYGSWFIVYVGIVIGAVTAGAHNMQKIGIMLWYLGAVNFVPVFIVITYRYIKLGNREEKLRPLICIYAAPASLLIVGCVKSFATAPEMLLEGLAVISYVIYTIAFIFCMRTIKNKFYPSIAAFTFPFMISANATKQLSMIWNDKDAFGSIFYIQFGIAVALYLYVLGRYFIFFSNIKNSENHSDKEKLSQVKDNTYYTTRELDDSIYLSNE